MQSLFILRILGVMLMLFSVSMIPPLLLAFLYDDGATSAFLYSSVSCCGAGLLLYLPLQRKPQELRARDGFIVAVAAWLGLGLFGALPFLFLPTPAISWSNALFESVSGLTTTGATVFSSLETLPPSLLFYRQELQWLGGIGILVLAVALMPILGVGGMQLYRAEISSPLKDNKLTPRIAETAKSLWYLYLALTVLCAICYALAGMGPYDAVAHSFSTVSIGGFSPYDDNLGHFQSVSVRLVAMIFIFICGANFALHIAAWHSGRLRTYLEDSEFKVYLLLLFVISLFCCSYLLFYRVSDDPLATLETGVFHSLSITTTAGFTLFNMQQNWPIFIPILLLFTSFAGGCAGSVGGGLKIIRVLLLFKQGLGEIRKLVHPSAVIHIKVGGRPIPTHVIQAVWGFFAAYVFVFILLLMLLLACAVEVETAFFSMVACMNNLGPGLSEVSSHYGGLPPAAKWILTVAMLMGRLEVFPLLVLLTPTYWRA